MSEKVEVGPKTKDVARRLLAAAEVENLPVSVVETTLRGFLVPESVAKGAEEIKAAEEAAAEEAAKPAPKKGATKKGASTPTDSKEGAE